MRDAHGNPASITLAGRRMTVYPAPSFSNAAKNKRFLAIHHRLKEPYEITTSGTAFVPRFELYNGASDYLPLADDLIDILPLYAAILAVEKLREFDSGIYQSMVNRFNTEFRNAKRNLLGTNQVPNQARIKGII